MTNEEFQKLVLEKLERLEVGQREIKEELQSVRAQTADNWSDIAKLKSMR